MAADGQGREPIIQGSGAPLGSGRSVGGYDPASHENTAASLAEDDADPSSH